MKAEDISKAIGKLDEELISPVQEERKNHTKKQKRTKKLWRTIAACAACLGLIVGATAMNLNRGIEPGTPGTSSSDNGSGKAPFGGETVQAAALATAAYPEMAQYPDEMSCFDEAGAYDSEKWDSMYEPWSAQIKERHRAGEALLSPDDFYQKTIQTFLSGTDTENRVYSPVNVYMALAMLAEITDGESRSQILDLLGVNDIEKLRTQVKNLWTANYRNDGATTSVLANSLWLNENVTFKQNTLDVLAQDYYASSFNGNPASPDMTKALRAWLNEQTGGLLKESVDQVTLDTETLLALCSTVYFRAKWDTRFDQSNNDQKIFHKADGDIPTEFMNATNNYGPYYWDEDFGAISLPFVDGGRMWLILPDEGKSVGELLNRGTYLSLCREPQNWENQKTIVVHYSVPKFDVSSDMQLAEGLQSLGVTDVFDGMRSDFSPLSEMDGVFVSDAKHAARVTIDEEGCTAAVFTEMMMAGAAMPPEEEIDFILDRPFLFVITSDTDSPLFTGIVNQP